MEDVSLPLENPREAIGLMGSLPGLVVIPVSTCRFGDTLPGSEKLKPIRSRTMLSCFLHRAQSRTASPLPCTPRQEPHLFHPQPFYPCEHKSLLFDHPPVICTVRITAKAQPEGHHESVLLYPPGSDAVTDFLKGENHDSSVHGAFTALVCRSVFCSIFPRHDAGRSGGNSPQAES